MNAKVLLAAWTICALWAFTAPVDGELPGWPGRADLTAAETARRSHAKLDHATAPDTAPDLVTEWLPIIEARVRDKAPELIATFAATGLVWLVVGAIIRPR